MAKRLFSLDVLDESRLRFPDLPDKSRFEAYSFSWAITPWIPCLEARYGNLVAAFHLDAGDDPPDVVVQFREKSIGFEIVELRPSKIAHFDAVVSDIKRQMPTTSASLTGASFNDHAAMKSYAAGFAEDKGWVSDKDESKSWSEDAQRLFRKKSERTGYDFIVMMGDARYLSYMPGVAGSLHEIVSSSKTNPLSLILHCQINLTQYRSWLIEKGRLRSLSGR